MSATTGKSAAAAADNVMSGMSFKIPGLTAEQQKIYQSFGVGNGKAVSKTLSEGSAVKKAKSSSPVASTTSSTISTIDSSTKGSNAGGLTDFIGKFSADKANNTIVELARAMQNDLGKNKPKGGGKGNGRANKSKSGNRPPNGSAAEGDLTQRVRWLENQMGKHAKILSFHDTALRLDRKEQQHCIEYVKNNWLDQEMEKVYAGWKSTLPKPDEDGAWVDHPLGPWKEVAYKTFCSLIQRACIAFAVKEHPGIYYCEKSCALRALPPVELSAADTEMSNAESLKRCANASATTTLDIYEAAIEFTNTMSTNYKSVQRFYKLKLMPAAPVAEGEVAPEEKAIWVIRVDRAVSHGRAILTSLFSLAEHDLLMHTFEGTVRGDHAPKGRLIKEVERTIARRRDDGDDDL